MKKTWSLAAALVFASFTPAVMASESEQGVETGTNEAEEDVITSLTLEEALDYAKEDNTSLLLMDYQLQNIKSQLNATEADTRDAENDIEDMEDRMDDLRDIQRETGERTFQQRYEIQNGLEELEDMYDDLIDSIEQLETNIVTMEYDQQEAEAALELATASTFTQIVMNEAQLAMQEEQYERERVNVENARLRYDIGVAPRQDLDEAQREWRRVQSDVSETKRQLEHDKSLFTLDLGISYHDDLEFKAPEIESVVPIEQEEDTDTLMENTYMMKKAKEDLALAEYEQEQVYEDDDADSYDREQADLAVDIEKQNIAQVRQDVTESIDSLFADATQAYQSLLEAQDEWDYANTDHEKRKVQLDAGLMAQADFDSAKLQLQQAELSYKMAQYEYFLVQQQIEALRAGVVPSS
ncbi:Outer membrane protein TolC [Alteribacillus persepolensis]|uniref:Outer membrane protein TolC n=1 Tax=Alteribacillus persepolensis TaxID=568899 RepID=A0A1G8JR09_9BACI|nr:TolC family protein [Alteribacillus persepolensis]SDI33615.1 Outer membrane protein TolC [Alteribacillus persepolensis]